MKPVECKNCVGYNWGPDFTSVTGSGSLGVTIIGEASGGHEADEGVPFVEWAESGSVLERCFRRCGYEREQFQITNILRCRPPQNHLEGADYEHEAIAHCKQHLSAVIAAQRPRAILALGGIAARTLTGYAGRRQGIQSIRGYVLPNVAYPGIPVIPSLHPAFLRRGKMAWLGILIRDLQLAVSVAANGPVVAIPTRYTLNPTIDRVRSFLEQARNAPLLAYDIETAYSLASDEDEIKDEEEGAEEGAETHLDPKAIVQIQFSLGAGTGIAIDWKPQFLPLIKEILALPNCKIDFNGRGFDRPRLRENGMVINGEVHDVMLCWHHLQPDLPRNLQSVASFYAPEFGPWKHLSGVDLADYGCRDVDILHRIFPKIEADLRAKGLWRGYERHVYQLAPILDRMSERGIPIDPIEQGEFTEFLDGNLGDIDGQIQVIVPEALKNVLPKQGFVRCPADTTGLIQRSFIAKHAQRNLCSCVDPSTGEIGWTKRVVGRCPVCKGKGFVVQSVIGPITRYCRLEPFKASQQQLTRYMRHRGHPVPKAIGEDRETTAKLFLERMFKKHKDPLYGLLLDYRAYQKMRGSYTWAFDPNGRCHPIFTFSPATGQLAAINPNCLTIPAPKGQTMKDKIANRFRQTIAAPPGYVLGEFDYSGFHTSTFAFEARDPVYFRLANKIRDPHSFLTAVLLKLSTPEKMIEMEDAELIAFLNWVKKNHKALRDGQAKPAILGFALGLGGNKLYEQNRWDPDLKAGFRSKGEADRTVAELRATFPKGYAYQNNIRQIAHKQGYLLNPHGFIRIFWDVLRIDPRTHRPIPGDQAEAAIAFNVQCDAHGHLKDAVLRLEARGLLERYGLINLVHDSMVFCCESSLREECCYEVAMEMEKPSTVLRDDLLCPNGLVIAVESKWGPNLAQMKGA